MQRYYRAAKLVRQFNVILLQNLHARLFPTRPAPSPLDAQFQVVDELLDVRAEDLFETRPAAMLDAFLVLQRHPELKGMSATTLRALWRNRHRVDARFRDDPVNRANFLQVFREARGLTHELRRMNLYGILGNYLPAFGRIVGQMQHDLFHVYTVDEHILMVIRNLRRFCEAQHAHEYPLCSRLMADFQRKEVLYLAGLFHDIAKGRGGDHSRLGEARRPPLLPAPRTAARGHGARRLAGRAPPAHVGGGAEAGRLQSGRRRRLRGNGARRPPAHRAVPAHGRRHPRHQPEGVERMEGEAARRPVPGDARAAGRAPPAPRRSPTACTSGRPTRSACCGCTRSATAPRRSCGRASIPSTSSGTPPTRSRGTPGTCISMPRAPRRSSAPGSRAPDAGLQVVVYLPDQKDLFARVCGYFGRAGLSILEAKVHTTRHGYALDTFAVHNPFNRSTAYRETIQLTEFELKRVLAEQQPLEPPPAGRISRRVRHFPLTPEVRIFPDDKGVHYILEIVAGDRPGLLAQIAYTLAKANISVFSAKINTLGERAEDVFLIDGASLHDEQALLQLETALYDQLRLP